MRVSRRMLGQTASVSCLMQHAIVLCHHTGAGTWHRNRRRSRWRCTGSVFEDFSSDRQAACAPPLVRAVLADDLA